MKRSRIAKIEQNRNFDPRKAVLYFYLTFEDYNAEEDGVNFTDRQLLNLEAKAVKNIERMLRVKVQNEGHDRFDALVCKIFPDSVDEVAEILKVVERETVGGDDIIDVDVEYFQAQGFTLFPQGVNGKSYQMGGNNPHEDLEDYLEANMDYGVSYNPQSLSSRRVARLEKESHAIFTEENEVLYNMIEIVKRNDSSPRTVFKDLGRGFDDLYEKSLKAKGPIFNALMEYHHEIKSANRKLEKVLKMEWNDRIRKF